MGNLSQYLVGISLPGTAELDGEQISVLQNKPQPHGLTGELAEARIAFPANDLANRVTHQGDTIL